MSYCLVIEIKTPWNILVLNTGQSTNREQHAYVPLTVLLHAVWSRNSLKSLTKITFTCNNGITVWAVKLCHILCVFLQDVHLHGAALCETSMADVTLVWLLTCNRRRRVSYSPKRLELKHTLTENLRGFYQSVSSCVSSAYKCLCWHSCTDCTGRVAPLCESGCAFSTCSPRKRETH